MDILMLGAATRFIGGTLLSLAHLLLVGYIVYSWVKKYYLHQPSYVRSSLFITGCFWLAMAVFLVLVNLELFNRTTTTLTLLLIAGISRVLAPTGISKDSAGTILESFNAAWKLIPTPARVLAAGVFALATLRVARALIAPPLAWDSLTYHLLKAGRWVQSGNWAWENAPDAWQFYSYFPPTGDVYWAWTMLGTNSDAYLAVAGFLIWVCCAVSTYALALAYDLNKYQSFLVVLAVSSAPANVNLLSSGYVDTVAAAVITAGSCLLVSGIRQKNTSLACVATLAMALGVGIKTTFFPYLAVSLGTLVWLVTQAGVRPLSLILTLACTGTALFWQIYLIAIGHTPFYPVNMTILGWTLEPGSREFNTTHFSSRYTLPYLWEMPRAFWRFLFKADEFTGVHYNLTWTFLPLLGGTVYLLISRAKHYFKTDVGLVTVGLFGSGLLIFASLWGPTTATYREVWVGNMARLFFPWYTMLLVIMATWKKPLITVFLYVIILINTVTLIPRHWIALDVYAALIGLTIILFAALGSYVAIGMVRPGKLLAGLVLTGIAVAGLHVTRSVFRAKYYASTHETFDVQKLTYDFPGEAVNYLDQTTPSTIAFASDYAGAAYRWFRYPLLGSRLQNRVVYIPPTVNGDVLSYEPDRDILPLIDYNSWFDRLLAEKARYVVVSKPFPIEAEWMKSHPHVFELVLAGSYKQWLLYKFKPGL